MNKKSDSVKLKKREAIILSAKELIIKNGYQKTNVEDITKNIEIAKGSFYTYFKSKDQMILEIIDEAYEHIKNRNEQLLNSGFEGRELIEVSLKNRYNPASETIVNILFFYHLTMNLESINLEVKISLFKIKECNVEFWSKVIEHYNPKLSKEKSRKYSEYIDEMLAYSMKNTLFFSKDMKKLFVSNFDEVIQRANGDAAQKEIETLYEIILKICS